MRSCPLASSIEMMPSREELIAQATRAGRRNHSVGKVRRLRISCSTGVGNAATMVTELSARRVEKLQLEY